MRATEPARTRSSDTGWPGDIGLAVPEAPAKFGEFGSRTGPPATLAARAFPKRVVGNGADHAQGVLILLCRVKAGPAIAAERTIDRAVRRRALVVDGYVRSTPPRDWGGTPASIDRGLIGRCVGRRGWRVGCLFEEPTTTRLGDPGSRLRDALERIESKESDGLVVARFKNLASSVEEAVAVLERIQAAGGRFVSVCDGIDLGGSSARTVLRLLVSVLEW